MEESKPLENKIKGTIAENIVEFLFRQNGYRVINFGYEFAMQTIRQIQLEREEEQTLYKDSKRGAFDDSEITERLYSAPDFLVFSREGKFTLVEVKFRSNPRRMSPGEVRGIASIGLMLNCSWLRVNQFQFFPFHCTHLVKATPREISVNVNWR